MNIKSLAKGLALLATLFLVGCADDHDFVAGEVPTDTSLVFSVFPPGYFDGSYSVSYSLTGSSSDGSFTATLLEKSGSTILFMAQPVVTIDQQLSVTGTTTGAIGSSSSQNYYSTDIFNLTLVGSLNITAGVIAEAASISLIPLEGSIGDFGNVGFYTLSAGGSLALGSLALSWALLDGFDGKAKLEKTAVSRDSAGALDTTQVDTYTISQEGTVSGVDIKIIFHQLDDLIIILSGS
jgi:hypothetical protein